MILPYMNEKVPSGDTNEENGFLLENLNIIQNGKQSNSKIAYEPYESLSFEEIRKLDEKYVMNTYARMPVAFSYGSGEFLYDDKGNEYIDFLSGIAVTAVGHVHADIIEALNHQADRLWHSSNIYFNQQQALLARALIEISFPGKVFFCNSGTEANEAAIKLMRSYGMKHNKKTILALNNSFHGRTFGSMSVTGQKKIREGFGPLLENIEFVDPNDVQALDSVFNESVAGIIMEPILGEGGVIPLTDEFLIKARELCNKNKALLVFDEVQTGIGRTGTYFAYESTSIKPDVITLAKGLGGGFPIGAMIVSEAFTGIFDVGMHGSTFGGNHLATAVSYEVLRLIESNKVLENVKSMSAYLMELLYNLQAGYPDKILGIRGKGLLIGIVLNDSIEARTQVQKALDKKLVIGRAADHVLRLAPPLIVRSLTIEKAVAKLEDLIREI